MKNLGKIFEDDVKQSCKKEGLFIHRLKDNAMSYIESDSVYTTKNDYDFLIYKKPILLALELKHTTYPSISIQVSEDVPERMIKWHQIQGLLKASKYDGVYAGFLLSFSSEELNKEFTYYISIQNFMRFLNRTTKKSITAVDIMSNGGIRVNQVLLRTHYHYQISDLLNTLIASSEE